MPLDNKYPPVPEFELAVSNLLTKREQFAMAAMQALLASPDIGISKSFTSIAGYSVEYADELIKELERTK